jgi:N-6 DNA Methylase/Eco57I restriction-modification methylase
MLPGFSGHLVSEFFLESQLAGGPESLEAARVRRQLATWRRECRSLGPSSSVLSLLEVGAAPLLRALGFDPPSNVEHRDRILVSATVGRESQRVGLVVAPWGHRLDPLWRPAVTDAMRRSAHWCLLFNGTHLRIVEAGRLHSRRHAEFDIDLAIEDDRAFAAFWWLARADRFADEATMGASSLHALVAASERHASGVCRSLRDGVLAASADVLGALIGRRMRAGLDDSFEQALTIVYRLLFLLFAEARGLVPLWHPLYRDSYSIDALRGAAEQSRGALGLWDALRAIARLAHAGCRAGDLRVTPFNGRLFAPSRTPLADRHDLDDEAARRAVLALSTRPAPDRNGRERIAYRDLGVEQLGAVYETLLDYQPRVQPAGSGRRGAAPTVMLMAGSGVRKATGTFYTPQSIAEYLVRRTLGPLVRNAPPDRILGLRIVDPAMGSGAFLVAACRYLAAAYETSLVRAGGYHDSDFGERERVSIRRTIADRCLYGVDLNPMAVQLARLSMWLATLAADRPLTFLDHRLLVGDSLVGAWLSTIRHAPVLHPRRRAADSAGLPLFDGEAARRALTGALPIRFTLEQVSDDTLEQVRAKEQALASLTRRDGVLSAWKRIADLWCASWFSTTGAAVPASAFGALSDAILTGRGALPGRAVDGYLRRAEAIAASRRFFHWELEFPEVFVAADGSRLPAAGFDAIIGNPPWDMIRADAGSADARSRSRDEGHPLLRFTRDSGLYTAQSDGHANRYQLFLERAMALTRPGGRLGLVLPAGLATDHGSARLRSRLVAHCDVDALVGFDNHRGVFPIHRSVRFLLVTATAGSPTARIACRFGEQDPAALEAIGDEAAGASSFFPISITPALLDRLSGDALTIPDLRTTVDLAIVERAAALFPPCGSSNGWSARFGRELNATDDRGHFRADGSGLPVVEGKQLEPFRVHLERSRHTIADRDVRRLLGSPRHDRPRLGYRDVASATNRLTLIAAILPPGCVSTHTVFCLRTRLPLQAQYFLCGLFNSFVVNYLVRLRVTTHVTTATVERLPLPRREDGPRSHRLIAALARVLARRHDPYASARLQALVAELYQLTSSEFAHVLETFPLVSREEQDAALTLLVATEARR